MKPPNRQRACLVTGGGGFIGSHLVERLVARGDRVVVIDNFSTGRRSNLPDLRCDRLKLIEADVSEGVRTLEAGEFHQIYHLAAAVGVRLVIEKPIHTIETNVLETSAILEFASSAATPILVASTSEIYGKSTKTPFAEDDDVLYGPTTLHRWSYACSKAIDEYLALAHHREHGTPVTIARLFNTVGPRQVGAYGMVLPRFVAAALAGSALEVYGDGLQTRCFCDVRDVVEVLMKMLEVPGFSGRVFNVGDDRPITIHALAQLVVRVLNADSQIVNVPYEEAFGTGFDDLRDRRPDLTRLRSATGWRPQIPLEQTIRDVAAEQRGSASSSLSSTSPAAS
jgi:UDP-glucose 4-epimerase